jgi:hypothetical protein
MAEQTKGAERSVALSIATIFVAVFVFHADLHATAGPILKVPTLKAKPVLRLPAFKSLVPSHGETH